MARRHGLRGADLSELYEEIFQTETPTAEPIWIRPPSPEKAAELANAPAFPEYVDWLDDKDDLAALLALIRRKLNDLPDPYEDSNALPFPSVVLAEIYRQITGIRNYPQLVGHFRRQTYQADVPVHERLGFDGIPGVNTLRKASKERFTHRTNERISYWALHLTQIAIEHEFEFPNTDEERLANNGGIVEVPIERKRGYAQGALDLLRDDMPISKADNAIHDDYGIHFDFSLHLCDTGGAPEAELENFADNRGLQTYEDVFADAETFRNDIYRTNIWEWVSTMNEWTDRILDAVYPMDLRSRGVPIAVDTTNIPTWSNEQSDLPGVLGTKKMPNTHYAYRVFTAQAVSDGMPFQIAHSLQMTSANRGRRLMGLLDEVESRGFDIGLLLADSEFAPGEVVNEIKNRGVNFVIQVPNDWVSSYTDNFEDENKTFGVVDEYTMNEGKGKPKETTNTLFCSYEHLWSEEPKTIAETSDEGDDEDSEDDGDEEEGDERVQLSLSDEFRPEPEYLTDKQDADTGREIEDESEDIDDEDKIDYSQKNAGWLTYITNLDVNEREAQALREYYKYRWSLESSYSNIKENFLPKTKSTDLGLRTYLYLFGLTAYNAWVAANAKCRRQHLEGSERHRPPIRARRFTTIGQQRYRDEFVTDYVEF